MELTLSPSFIVVAVVAVAFAGLGKGGFSGLGMMSTPLIAMVIPPVKAAALMLPLLLIQDAFSVWNYRRDFDLWNLKVLLPGAVIGVAGGYLLAAHLPDASVELVLGAISTVFALRSLLRMSGLSDPVVNPNRFVGWLCGIGSGFTSMVAHAGGPPFQIFVMPQRLSRDVYVGTSVIFFAIVNWMKVVPYLVLGQLGPDIAVPALVLAPVAVISTLAGIRLVRRVNQERFYAYSYVLLFLVGLKLVWDAVRQLGLPG